MATMNLSHLDDLRVPVTEGLGPEFVVPMQDLLITAAGYLELAGCMPKIIALYHQVISQMGVEATTVNWPPQQMTFRVIDFARAAADVIEALETEHWGKLAIPLCRALPEYLARVVALGEEGLHNEREYIIANEEEDKYHFLPVLGGVIPVPACEVPGTVTTGAVA